MTNTPHYLLFAESGQMASEGPSWRFLLQDVATQNRLVVTDHEPATCGERLELLAVVRGLEALDGPAKVTLVTKSRYVSRGFKVGLADWRSANWCWERFGRTVPVKDHDLWQRVDRALQFHEVDCQAWQFAEAEVAPASASPARHMESARSTSESPAVGEQITPMDAPNFSRRAERRRRTVTVRRGSTVSRQGAWTKARRKIQTWVESHQPRGNLLQGAT